MFGRTSPRRALGPVLALVALAVPNQLAAQESPVFGFEPAMDPTDPESLWIDPAILYGYTDAELTDAPDVDFAELHDSDVFANGVDFIEVDDDRLAELHQPHIRALQVRDTAAREIERLTGRIGLLRPRVQSLSNEIAHEHREEERLAEEIITYKKAIAEFAVRAFIADEDLAEVLAVPDSDAPENRVLADEVREGQFGEIEQREQELARRQARRARLEDDRRAVREQIRELQARRLGRLDDLRELDRLVEQTAVDYRAGLHARLPAMVRGTDIPLVALNAYVIAARSIEIENPRCGLEWWMLAGIGLIESQHGHFGDSMLDVNGNATTAITGPALDGRILDGADFLTAGTPVPEPTTATAELPVASPASSGVDEAASSDEVEEPVIKRLALISDTDGGRLDGDTRYDRAVGPMQFIPQTWRSYESDGNNDGDLEPQNVYDAALASARYLCTAAGSMRSEEGRQLAYFAYNHDDAYTEAVAAAADRYRRRVVVPSTTDGSAPHLGLADVPAEAVSRLVSDAVTTLDLTDLPDW